MNEAGSKPLSFLERVKQLHLSMPQEWTSTTKHIVTVLFTFAGSNDGGGICASVGTIARHAGERERTVERVIRKLREKKFLDDDGWRVFQRPSGDKVRVKSRRLVLAKIARASNGAEPDSNGGLAGSSEPVTRVGLKQRETDTGDGFDGQAPTIETDIWGTADPIETDIWGTKRPIEPVTGDTQTKSMNQEIEEPRVTRARDDLFLSDPPPSAVPPREHGRRRAVHTSNEDSLETEFAEWWNHVPKKTDKLEAAKLFKEARTKKQVMAATLIDAMRRYAEQYAPQGADNPRFSVGPAKWLRGEKWNDETPPHGAGVHRERACKLDWLNDDQPAPADPFTIDGEIA